MSKQQTIEFTQQPQEVRWTGRRGIEHVAFLDRNVGVPGRNVVLRVYASSTKEHVPSMRVMLCRASARQGEELRVIDDLEPGKVAGAKPVWTLVAPYLDEIDPMELYHGIVEAKRKLAQARELYSIAAPESKMSCVSTIRALEVVQAQQVLDRFDRDTKKAD